jgi:hypothetical protein
MLQKVLKLSVLNFHAGTVEDRLLIPDFFLL